MIKNKKGFTLIELITVIAVIGIIAAITVGMTMGFLSDTKEDALSIQKENIIDMAKIYFYDNLTKFSKTTRPINCTDTALEGSTQRKCKMYSSTLVSEGYIEQPKSLQSKEEIVYEITFDFILTNGKVSDIKTTIDNGIILASTDPLQSIVASNLEPISDSQIKTNSFEKAFSVTNSSDFHQKITINLTNISIPNELKNIDFRWGLFNTDTNKGVSYGIFKYASSSSPVNILRDVIIDKDGAPKNYTLRIWIHDNGDATSQASMLNKTFSADIEVKKEWIEYTPETCFKHFDESTGELYGSMPDGGYNFENCGTNVVVPKTINGVTVTIMSGAVFGAITEGAGVTSVILPDTLRVITGSSTFYGASTNFTHLTIPENVIQLDSSVIDYNTENLSSITLPENINIGNGNDFNVKTLVLTGGSLGMSSYGGAQTTDVVIMEGPTSIAPNVFDYSTQLTSIEIPSSVTSICPAFNGCTNLEQIILRGKTEEDTANTSNYPVGWNCVDVTGDFISDPDNATCNKYAEVIYRP